MDDDTPSTGRLRRALTALVAVLMVTSVAIGAGAGAAAAAGNPTQQSLQEDDDSTGNETLDPADQVFVRENGDAILRYDTESEDGESELSSAEYGLDVGRGIFYGLVVTDLEETSNVTGSANAVLEPGGLTAEGDLTAPQPSAVEDLSMTVEGVRTQQNNRFDADGRLVVSTRSAPELGLVETADTSLSATVGPNSLDASGEVSAQTTTQLGEPMDASFELTEGENTYTLDAAQNQTIREFSKDQWDSRENATRTIKQRYGSVAESFGGTSTVTLNSYEFINTSQRGVYRLDVDYTVEYEGVDEGLRRVAAAGLANSEEFNLTREEASDIAANVTELTVERISADVTMGANAVDGSFDIQLENYNDALLAGLDAAAVYSPPEQEVPIRADQLEDIRARIEAQQAAGLTRTYSLSASHQLNSQRQAVIELEAQSRTENWQAYVSELESRDITVANQEYAVAADTVDGEVVANASLSVEQEGVVDDAVGQFLNATESDAGDEDMAQARNFVRAFRQAGFEKARTDVTLREGNVTFEAGAKFEDMAAFRDVLQQSGRIDLAITDVVARTNETGTVNQYVYVSGAVEAGANESAVRELAVVNESTTVNMPGTYNRTFPEMDTVRAFEYLDLEPPTPTPGGSGDGGDSSTASDGQAGFGVAAALAALAGAALLARRD
jgi:PGF-CTERM protein